MRTLTATFSTLSRDLNPHAKGNRWPKIKETKEAKEDAKFIGKNEINHAGYSKDDGPVFNKARVSITLYADTKLSRARQCYVPTDKQNLIAAVKPHIDGLKAAGWVADDNKNFITGFDPVEIITGKDAGGKCALVITFTEVE